MSRLVILSFCLIGLMSCKKLEVKESQRTVLNEKGGVTCSLIFIKNKGNAVDLEVKLYNSYNHPVTLAELEMDFNGKKGKPGEEYISSTMPADEEKTSIAVFHFNSGAPEHGRVTFKIGKIFEEKDGKPTGKTHPPLVMPIDI